MRNIALLVLMIPAAVSAQTNPPPFGAFTYSAGSWAAAATTSITDPITYTPPPIALYCFNSSTQKWVPADSSCFGSGSLPNPATSVFYDEGGAVFNVKAYGAKGDGVTNDCTAIGAAITALTSAGSGSLLFPEGNYAVSSACHLTLSVPTLVKGTGKCSYYSQTACGSVITSTDTSGVLFTVTSNVAKFSDIGLVNSAGTTPTAGSAILTNGAQAGQMVDYDGIYVWGFFDDIDVGVGAEWSLRASFIKNPVRYALYVQNTVNADAGDWVMSDNYIEAGTLTSSVTSAGVYYTSSGGGKIIGNKILGGFVNGIKMDFTAGGSGQTIIVGNSIEQMSHEPILMVKGWPYIQIADNFLLPGSGYSGINAGGSFSSGYIGGGTIQEGGAGVTVPAVQLTGTGNQNLTIAPFSWNGFTAATSITCAQNCTDLSGLPTLTVAANSGQYAFIGGTSGTNLGTGYYFNYVANNDWVIGNNAYFNGSSWIAKLASADSEEYAFGAIKFRVDTGLTPGSSFSPTVKFTINSDGTVQPGSNYKSSDGTAGFTGSCASTTTLTVKNGLITGCA